MIKWLYAKTKPVVDFFLYLGWQIGQWLNNGGKK